MAETHVDPLLLLTRVYNSALVLALYLSDIDVCPPGNPPPWTPSLVTGYQGRGLLDLVGYDLVFFAADLTCHVMAPPGSLTCLSTVS
jgi:hypothetical protein